MSSKWIGTAALAIAFLVASGSAQAQSAPAAPPPPPPHGPQMAFERMEPGPFGPEDAIYFVGFEAGLGEDKTVAGSPYTASFSTQTTQALSDGNHIQRTTSGTLARDSQGRVRRDMTLPAIGPWAASGKAAPQVTFINDPVAGTRFFLHPDQKTAEKMPGHSFKGHKRGNANAPKFPRRDSTEVVTTSLGTQMINGVSAEGTRYTRTIPAGEIGNEKPIQIVTERWFSNELQTVVMTKRSDPRSGETLFQLTNIQRQEPAATLFQVPSDYSVVQGGRMRGRQMKSLEQ
ncbi:MAG: hypothetical protein WBP79_00745 [Candidatus Acidiferrales bacterium]